MGREEITLLCRSPYCFFVESVDEPEIEPPPDDDWSLDELARPHAAAIGLWNRLSGREWLSSAFRSWGSRASPLQNTGRS